MPTLPGGAGAGKSRATPGGNFALCGTGSRCYRRPVPRFRSFRIGCRYLIAVALAGGLAAPAPAPGDDLGGVNAAAADSVQALQQRIVSDPEMADAVQALRDDPQVQALLTDPAISGALARGDMAALLNDPRIRDLAADPAVQNITRQVAR